MAESDDFRRPAWVEGINPFFVVMRPNAVIVGEYGTHKEALKIAKIICKGSEEWIIEGLQRPR